MRLLLINPQDSGSELALLTYRNPTPLALPLLVSLTPPDVEVTIQDENLAPVDLEWAGDLVALTVAVHKAPRAATLARHFRRCGLPVLMGGLYPTLSPQAALAEADAVVAGPVEGVWSRVLADLHAGRLGGVYQAEEPPAIAAVDDRHVALDETRCYVEAGRGCNCGDPWCAVCHSQGERVRRRSPQEIAAEIAVSLAAHPALNLRFLLGVGLLDDAAWAGALCEALAPLGIWWSASAGLATPAEVLARVGASGCFLVLFDAGPELDGDAAAFVERCHQAGLSVMARFQFGYPGDGPDSFQRTLAFCDAHEIELADFGLRAPPWGTPAYHAAQAEGHLLRREPEWFDGRHAVVCHETLSAEALETGLREAWQGFYGKRSLRRRLQRHLDGGKFPVLSAEPRPYRRHELVPLMNLALKVAVVDL